MLIRSEVKLVCFPPDHKRLLWEYCTEGNVKMAEFLLDIPGIYDAEMDDGTTAFAIALGRGDCELIRLFMGSCVPSNIDPISLTKRAIIELDRYANKKYSALREELRNGLEKNNVHHGNDTHAGEKICEQ